MAMTVVQLSLGSVAAVEPAAPLLPAQVATVALTCRLPMDLSARLQVMAEVVVAAVEPQAAFACGPTA